MQVTHITPPKEPGPETREGHQQAAPDQTAVDKFEHIYFGNQDQTIQVGSDVAINARKGMGELIIGKLEAVQHQSEAQLHVLNEIMAKIHQPGHRMTVQEAMQFQAANLGFVETQTYAAAVSKKADDAIKSLFTNQ